MRRVLRKKKTLGIVLLLLLFPYIALAQDSIRMDLKQVLEFALSESPTVHIADREIVRKEYAKKEQIAALYPNLSAGATYNRTLQKQVMAMSMNGEVNRIEVGTNNNWGAGANLALPIVAPTLWKTIQLSALDIEMALESARSSKIALVAEVKRAYYSLLLAQDSYRVLQISYDNALFNAKNITDKYNQGLTSEFEKLRADVQVKNQKPGLVAAENGLYLANMQLKVLMGMDVNEPVRFEGNLVDFESQMRLSGIDLSTKVSIENNTELKQTDIQLMQLEKNTSLLKSAYLPTLSLSGNYQWSSLNNDFRIGHYQWTPYATVGLSLNIPIFEGRAKSHKVRQNQLNISNVQEQRVDLARNLELTVKNCQNNMRTAVEELDYNKENIVQAEKAYQISQKRFEVGSSTLLELNDAEVALTQARLAYNQSIYNYLAANAQLEQVVGDQIK